MTRHEIPASLKKRVALLYAYRKARLARLPVCTFICSPSGVVVVETLLLACLMFGTFSVLVRVTDLETVGLWVLVNALLSFSRAADFWSRGLSSFVGEARGELEGGLFRAHGPR